MAQPQLPFVLVYQGPLQIATLWEWLAIYVAPSLPLPPDRLIGVNFQAGEVSLRQGRPEFLCPQGCGILFLKCSMYGIYKLYRIISVYMTYISDKLESNVGI